MKYKFKLEDILQGKHPITQTYKLKKRLLKTGVFKRMCYGCGRKTWLAKPIPLELDHVDGNPKNHILGNLKLLCPNCHAFTPTYRAKNKGKRK